MKELESATVIFLVAVQMVNCVFTVCMFMCNLFFTVSEKIEVTNIMWLRVRWHIQKKFKTLVVTNLVVSELRF